MKHIMSAATIVLALVLAGHAQSTAAGKWQGETANGTRLELELTVKDKTLTGTLTRDGDRAPLSDGAVSNNQIAFKAKLGGQIESLSGEVRGDELRIWLDRQGAAKAIAMKRVKAK